MLTFAVVLGLVAWGAEMLLAHQVPYLRALCRRSILFNMITSLFITATLAAFFGASGLIVMSASLLSCLLSVLTYRLWREDE